MPGELTLPLGTLFGFLLVVARVGGALVFVPLPGMNAGPEPARVVLTLGFSLALFPLWPAVAAPDLAIGRLAVWLLAEGAFGATVGLAVALLIETLLVAAQAFGVQAGYSYASTIDPATEADSNVLLVFAQLTAGLLFFTLGLDREILRVFAHSMAAYPPGAFVLKPSTAELILRLGSAMFSTGLRLALPVVALLMLVDIALALMGRMHAQLQLIALAFPVKMLATLAFLAIVVAFFLPVFRAAAGRTFSSLLGML
ncbi:MAG: flagellar biosynthetic protein FliR [Bryobacteraceae bacterium]|jgi:flagellar biosynthetic protein FliR